jgi:hypothetical protein
MFFAQKEQRLKNSIAEQKKLSCFGFEVDEITGKLFY